MATTTYFGWETPDDTDLVKDGAAAIRTLGSAIDTSMSQLEGGTTGQILSKTSATDMAFTWIANDQGDITAVTAGTGISGGGTSGAVTVTNSMATAITTAGDLIKGTGSGTFDRLGIGSTGQVLTVASGAPSWATTAATSQNFSQIATSNLSGASSVTLTGISGMNSLIVIVKNATNGTNTYEMYLRPNNNTTGANYNYNGVRITPNSTYSAANFVSQDDTGTAGIQLSSGGSTAGDGSGTLRIDGCNSAGFKPFTSTGGKSSTASDIRITQGLFLSTSVITSININNGGGTNYTGGTITVFGSA